MSKFSEAASLDWTTEATNGFAYPKRMGKMTSNEGASLRKLRATPGMRSMVELRDDGAVAARRGAPNEDLAMATPDFIRIAKMLGQSLGLDEMEHVRVLQADEAITFAESGDRRVGVIHHDSLSQLLDTTHGA